VCTIPADDVNTYADQLDHDNTSVLDQLAPTRMKTRRCGKRSGRWLSDEAVQAKRQRRRLEARWRRTKLETDRVAYMKACHTANTHIVNSRRSFYLQRLQSVTCERNTPWRVIRELLHSEDRDISPNPREAKKLWSLVTGFSVFHWEAGSHARNVTGRLSTTPNLIMPPVYIQTY